MMVLCLSFSSFNPDVQINLLDDIGYTGRNITTPVIMKPSMSKKYCKSSNKHNLTARIICVHKKVFIKAIAYEGHISIRMFFVQFNDCLDCTNSYKTQDCVYLRITVFKKAHSIEMLYWSF